MLHMSSPEAKPVKLIPSAFHSLFASFQPCSFCTIAASFVHHKLAFEAAYGCSMCTLYFETVLSRAAEICQPGLSSHAECNLPELFARQLDMQRLHQSSDDKKQI